MRNDAPGAGASGPPRHRPDVRVAEYLYRHEAEFAAGFLRDAGIPYRLQIDDAGGADAGVTIARPAVLWVRAEDADEARELLSVDDEDEGADVLEPASAGDPGWARAPGDRRRDGTPGDDVFLVPLCRAERLVAGVLALALVGLASHGGEGAVPWVSVWESISLLGALALGLSAVSGKTLRAIQAILRVLSGTAP